MLQSVWQFSLSKAGSFVLQFLKAKDSLLPNPANLHNSRAYFR